MKKLLLTDTKHVNILHITANITQTVASGKKELKIAKGAACCVETPCLML